MTKDEIKAAYSMRDIVERYDLQPNRTGYINCPFHPDPDPSLKIYEKDFHCFGCGANGDIFDFVRMMEDVSFADAFCSLGGTYQKESRRTVRMRAVAMQREKALKKEAEAQFQKWRRKRLDEVCRLLRLLDAVIPEYIPYSDEWAVAIEMRETNNYKYAILASGTRADQEEMRSLNE